MAVTVPTIACVNVYWFISGRSYSQTVQALQSTVVLIILYLLGGQCNMADAKTFANNKWCAALLLVHNSHHQHHVFQVQDYVNDKLNFIGPVRARTGNEILKGFRSLEQHQAQLQLPILAVHGTSDRCTSLPVHPLSQKLHQFGA